MKQIAQQVRTQLLTLIMAGVTGAGFAAAAAAAEIGGGVNANVSAPGAARAGGAADAHMSPAGSANSNAQWQSGATRGADRAAERMDAHGAEMKQSGDADLEAADTATVKGKSKH